MECQLALTWSDIIAIYAGIVSTLVGIIEGIRLYRETKSKLVVNFSIYSQIRRHSNGTVGDWELVLSLSIINHSLSERFIYRPGIMVNKDKRSFSVILEDDNTKYPEKLTPGQSFDLSYSARTIKEAIEKVRASKVRAYVADTLGNKYYSNWVKAVDIKPYD
jgi:hypothetical protein